ncbi:unnamed protein product [Sphagnum jensenii]|uniref:Uncharacterized protein n=1 Tax=Sphagnum jensenii TaxID=128206 RepID=A0ABP0VIF9_9BRYO
MDVIDEIAGAEAVTVTGADGKKRRVIRRLPRTKEEQAIYQKGQELMASALKNISQLYQYDPSSVVDFAPIIQTLPTSITSKPRIWRRSGTSHRSRGNTGSPCRKLCASPAEKRSRCPELWEDLAAKRLNRNVGVFNLKEAGRLNRLNAAKLQYDLENKKKADLEQLRQNALNENQNQLQIGANLVGNDVNKAMGNRANQDAINQCRWAIMLKWRITTPMWTGWSNSIRWMCRLTRTRLPALRFCPQSGRQSFGWGLNNGAFGF